ncbi:hypothetical protein GGX14DRAFT_363358 [Mycena pura]|uniref:Uncharacterized protein n=1 Tax=Mycena pura TaxID=153505 RepID=A0AAD6VEE7_9AGAR|nr:hypothetical protein GGX14DRAFT_363358 [Mycena pura]
MQGYSFFLQPQAAISTFVLYLLTQATQSAAAISQRTIDDTFGDSVSGALPSYAPADNFSPNSDCSNCEFHPDPESAFKGTWHDSTQLPGGPAVSVTVSFTGTAISLFCILANTAFGHIATSDFSLSIDGTTHGTFTHTPDNTSDFIYQAKVFEVHDLANVEHKAVLSTNNPAGSLLLFDYASYTYVRGLPITAPHQC